MLLKQVYKSIIFFRKFVMDMIKMEPDIDPLAKETSYKTVTEETNSLSQEGSVLYLHSTEIKTECVDRSYDLKSEITFEETPVSIDFPIVKTEIEEEALELNRVEEEVKLEVTAEEDEVLTEGKLGMEATMHIDMYISNEGLEVIQS
ncbi:uncharacterized protein [Periplaneta americana]|uniref:uncharacterized protein isoform X3 n=1 Tax=Periplaneta americana TaxID=6978 RepID=UPI0037E9C374